MQNIIEKIEADIKSANLSIVINIIRILLIIIISIMGIFAKSSLVVFAIPIAGLPFYEELICAIKIKRKARMQLKKMQDESISD